MGAASQYHQGAKQVSGITIVQQGGLSPSIIHFTGHQIALGILFLYRTYSGTTKALTESSNNALNQLQDRDDSADFFRTLVVQGWLPCDVEV